MAHELIVTARKLAKANPIKPRQADLKRAVSTACERCKLLGFPDEIVWFGNAFVRLQKEHHDADYDPAVRFTKPEVALLIAQAERAIRSLGIASNQDKKALAALVLLRQRKA